MRGDRLLQCSPIAQSIHAAAFLLSGHVEKSPVLSGLMLPLCRSFLSNSSQAESLSTERIPNQIPFYSCLPELLTQNHTALQHTNICQHPPLPFHQPILSSFLQHPSSPKPPFPTPPPPILQSIISAVFSVNKRASRTVEEFLLCRLVWCAVMKGHGDREAY